MSNAECGMRNAELRNAMNRATLAILVAMPGIVGCSRGEEPEKQARVVQEEASLAEVHRKLPPLKIPTKLPQAPSTELRLSDLPAEGRFIFPTGTETKEKGDHQTVYEIEAKLSDVSEFYQKRGYRVTSNPAGLTIRPVTGDGLLQVVERPNRKLMLISVPRTRLREQ